MGSRINPNGLRLGLYKKWETSWFINRLQFSKFLHLNFELKIFLKGFLYIYPKQALLLYCRFIKSTSNLLIINVLFYRLRQKRLSLFEKTKNFLNLSYRNHSFFFLIFYHLFFQRKRINNKFLQKHLLIIYLLKQRKKFFFNWKYLLKRKIFYFLYKRFKFFSKIKLWQIRKNFFFNLLFLFFQQQNIKLFFFNNYNIYFFLKDIIFNKLLNIQNRHQKFYKKNNLQYLFFNKQKYEWTLIYLLRNCLYLFNSLKTFFFNFYNFQTFLIYWKNKWINFYSIIEWNRYNLTITNREWDAISLKWIDEKEKLLTSISQTKLFNLSFKIRLFIFRSNKFNFFFYRKKQKNWISSFLQFVCYQSFYKKKYFYFNFKQKLRFNISYYKNLFFFKTKFLLLLLGPIFYQWKKKNKIFIKIFSFYFFLIMFKKYFYFHLLHQKQFQQKNNLIKHFLLNIQILYFYKHKLKNKYYLLVSFFQQLYLLIKQSCKLFYKLNFLNIFNQWKLIQHWCYQKLLIFKKTNNFLQNKLRIFKQSNYYLLYLINFSLINPKFKNSKLLLIGTQYLSLKNSKKLLQYLLHIKIKFIFINGFNFLNILNQNLIHRSYLKSLNLYSLIRKQQRRFHYIAFLIHDYIIIILLCILFKQLKFLVEFMGFLIRMLPRYQRRKQQQFFLYLSNILQDLLSTYFNIKAMRIKFKGLVLRSRRTKVLVVNSGILNLPTLQKNIEYSNTEIITKRGAININLWILYPLDFNKYLKQLILQYFRELELQQYSQFIIPFFYKIKY